MFLRCRSRLRLWHSYQQFPAADTLHVYPALKQIGRYALFARSNRMSLLGVRRSRRVGSDNEFERLRDYAFDDPFKTIDWRATARRLKFTVRDHQSNQSQRIVFAIDCGRMMVNRTAGESLLDAAVYEPQELLEGGWVDGLAYEDEVVESMRVACQGLDPNPSLQDQAASGLPFSMPARWAAPAEGGEAPGKPPKVKGLAVVPLKKYSFVSPTAFGLSGASGCDPWGGRAGGRVRV